MAYVYCMSWSEGEIIGSEFQCNSNEITFDIDSTFKYNVKLNKEYRYRFGMDQSGKCVGIALVCANGSNGYKKIIIMDVLRELNYYYNVDTFFRDVYMLVERMIDGLNLEYFVMEQIPPIAETKYTNKYLAEIRGIVKDWFDRIPSLHELSYDKVLDIYPQQWKSLFYRKISGSGRNQFNKKEVIAGFICEKFPQLTSHIELIKRVGTARMEYDSLEAFGIVHGASIKFFDKNGNKTNSSPRSKNYGLLMYRYFRNPLIIEQIARNFEVFVQDGTLINMVYNTNYTVMQNVEMAIGNPGGKWIVMEVVDPFHLLGVAIEYGLEISSDYTLLMYVTPMKNVSGQMLKTLQKNERMLKILK